MNQHQTNQLWDLFSREPGLNGTSLTAPERCQLESTVFEPLEDIFWCPLHDEIERLTDLVEELKAAEEDSRS